MMGVFAAVIVKKEIKIFKSGGPLEWIFLNCMECYW